MGQANLLQVYQTLANLAMRCQPAGLIRAALLCRVENCSQMWKHPEKRLVQISVSLRGSQNICPRRLTPAMARH